MYLLALCNANTRYGSLEAALTMCSEQTQTEIAVARARAFCCNSSSTSCSARHEDAIAGDSTSSALSDASTRPPTPTVATVKDIKAEPTPAASSPPRSLPETTVELKRKAGASLQPEKIFSSKVARQLPLAPIPTPVLAMQSIDTIPTDEAEEDDILDKFLDMDALVGGTTK